MKNDSWVFPFSMLFDSIFDHNHDGTLSGWETIDRDAYWLEQQRIWEERKKKSQAAPQIDSDHPRSHTAIVSIHPSDEDDEDDYSWRDFCEDGSDYGIFPEDYETEEEYEAALEEAGYGWRDTCESDSETGIDPEDYETEEEYEQALAEAQRMDNDAGIIWDVSVECPALDRLEQIRKEDYPNKRRYNAAYTLADEFTIYLDDDDEKKEKACCRFILDHGDDILAANYLSCGGSHVCSFLYALAIKDHFDLPCSLPDEDERPEMEFCEILAKLAKRDIPLSLTVWEWCIEQFVPYAQYDEKVLTDLGKGVFDSLNRFSDKKEFITAVICRFEEKPAFGRTVMSLSAECYDDAPVFIAEAIKGQHYGVAEMLFKSELYKATDWKSILSLTKEIIASCSDGEQLEAIEYFRDHFFPVIKAVPDGMVQDEIPDFEKAIADYISEVEDYSERYAYTRKNAWRTAVPDGTAYGIDPVDYDTQQDYLDALNEAKYEWRQWYPSADENEYGLDVNDFETEDEFRAAMDAKEQEELEAQRQAAMRKQRALQEELAKDGTVYTYCGVLLPGISRPFFYRTNDKTIQIGDTVIVPYGYNNQETEGTVVSVGQYAKLAVPYPVEKTKMIIRKKND